MKPFAVCRVLAVAAFAVPGMAALAGAQTLRPRPTPTSQSPAGHVAPAAQQVTIPRGTSLQVEIVRHYPMQAGEAIEGRLLHPIYVNGRLAVPANTQLHGRVVALDPDSSMRWRGRLRGDFTPFRTARVQFDALVLPDGAVPIAAGVASDGAPFLRLTAPGITPKRSLAGRGWAFAKERLHEQVAYFTDPGLRDRMLQLLYHQLPYHPQRLAAQTAWSFELTAPVKLPTVPAAAVTGVTVAAGQGKEEIWAVHALLTQGLTSATARSGDPVQALVIEPVYNMERQLVVPQGATLIGKVTSARAARSFGRNGKLRFTFQQVKFPKGFLRPVEGSLAGAVTERTQNLQLDAEGTVTPRNQSSAIAPVLLVLLAGKALDQDGNMTAQTGVASNGFGLIGRIVGMAAGNRNLAAGIGFYAAGLSVYDNFLHSGRDVVFPKDTQIVIETMPLRAPVLKIN